MSNFDDSPPIRSNDLAREKTIQLRRRVPSRATDFWIALYASSPEKSLMGVVRAEGRLVDTPESLWPLVREDCGINFEEYLRYFQGASISRRY